MKLWVDDIRLEPLGWVKVSDGENAIEILNTYPVEEISLDHDLGSGFYTGYDVACWIENQFLCNENFIAPAMNVHSQNPVGVAKIKAVIESIERIRAAKVERLLHD